MVVEVVTLFVRNEGSTCLDGRAAEGRDLIIEKGLDGMKALSFEGRESCQFELASVSAVEGSEGGFDCSGGRDGDDGGDRIGSDGDDKEADGCGESDWIGFVGFDGFFKLALATS